MYSVDLPDWTRIYVHYQNVSGKFVVKRGRLHTYILYTVYSGQGTQHVVPPDMWANLKKK